MTVGLYRGYSSYEYQNKKYFGIKDIELVELDLLNHIFTRQRSRLMMPDFGTRIPDMVFEPLDELTLLIVDEDLRSVFNFDPRVSLVNLTITPDYDNNTATATALLYYIELNVTKGMDINIQFETV